MTVDLRVAGDVVSASSCALDRQYSGKEHAECEWCKFSPSDLLKAIYTWMKDPENSGHISKGDRAPDEPWLL